MKSRPSVGEEGRTSAELRAKTAEVERLQAHLEGQTRLLDNVAHELKNPLSVIYGYSTLLVQQQAQGLAPEELMRCLKAIGKNSERLSALLTELVESSRLSEGKVELKREAVPAARLAREAAEDRRLQADGRGIALALDLGPSSELPILADGHRVHQILANLLGNALKFTSRGGSITVSVSALQGFARFGVTDTGVGIAPEDLPRLFDRFYQCEDTRAKHSGLGLGLEICKGLVELHGGRIWAESEPGRGASFFFTLPLALHEQRHSPANAVDTPDAML